jgi:recombination protein RecT
VTHYEAMALKTVVRRLFRWLPMSIELAAAIEADERAELGLPQDHPLTVDVETGEIVAQPQQTQQPQAAQETPKQEAEQTGGQRDEWLNDHEAAEDKQ